MSDVVTAMRRSPLIGLLIFGCAYFAFAALGHAFSGPGSAFVTVWLPSGLVLGVLLVSPRTRWPAILATSIAANFLFNVLHQTPHALNLAFVAGNAIEAFISAAIIRHFVGSHVAFDQLRTVVVWAAATCLVAAPLAALVGSTALYMRDGGNIFAAWRVWWVADIVGTIILTPLVVGLSREDERRRLLSNECLAGVAALAASALLIFQGEARSIVPPSLLSMFLAYIAIRVGATGAALGASVLGLIVLSYSVTGKGYFAFDRSLGDSLLTAQLYLSVAALLNYVLAAVTAELRTSNLRLTQINETLEAQVAERTADVVATNKQLSAALRFNDVAQEAGLATFYSFNVTSGNVKRSASFETTTGYGPGSIAPTADGWRQLIHPEDVASVWSALDGAIATGTGFSLEYRVRHQAGHWMWVQDRAKVFRADDVTHVVGMFVDITDRKVVEESLASLQSFSQSLIESAPSMLYIFNLVEKRNTFISPQITPVLGYTPGEIRELTSSGFYNLFHIGDLPTIERHHKQLRTGELNGPVDIEYRMRHKDGSWRWLLSRDLVFERRPDGSVVSILGNAFDVTDRKNASAALRDVDMRLRAVADAAPILIWETDRSGVVFCNRHYLEFFGTTFDRIQGMGWVAFMHPQDGSAYLETYHQSFRERLPYTHEARFTRADGAERWLRSIGHPVGDDRFVGCAVDITDMKMAAEAIKENEARLSLALDAGRAGAWQYNPDTDVLEADGRFRALHDLPDEPPLTRETLLDAVFADDRHAVRQAFDAASDGRARLDVAYRVGRDRTPGRWINAYAELRVVLGQLQLVGLSQDITERKRYEERISLLMREVNHRSKNLLTVILAMARQTARHAGSGEFVPQFSQRLQGLSASQDIIVAGQWGGVSVPDLVRSQINHLGPDFVGGRVELDGPEVLLTPAAAQGIGMALHELSTNAIKYGALQNETGRVAISWHVEKSDDDASFVISWIESGGPVVVKPDTQGFGQTVIERMAALAADGEVDLNFAPDGLRWRLKAAADRVLYTMSNDVALLRQTTMMAQEVSS